MIFLLLFNADDDEDGRILGTVALGISFFFLWNLNHLLRMVNGIVQEMIRCFCSFRYLLEWMTFCFLLSSHLFNPHALSGVDDDRSTQLRSYNKVIWNLLAMSLFSGLLYLIKHTVIRNENEKEILCSLSAHGDAGPVLVAGSPLSLCPKDVEASNGKKDKINFLFCLFKKCNFYCIFLTQKEKVIYSITRFVLSSEFETPLPSHLFTPIAPSGVDDGRAQFLFENLLHFLSKCILLLFHSVLLQNIFLLHFICFIIFYFEKTSKLELGWV